MSAEDPSAAPTSEFASPFVGLNQTQADQARKRAEFQQLAAKPDIYEMFAQSLAPSIWCAWRGSAPAVHTQG